MRSDYNWYLKISKYFNVGVVLSIVAVYLLRILEKRFSVSEFESLKKNGLLRGRPRLSEQEKQNRKETTIKRQEARRRASIVLQHRHIDEYNEIFEKELETVLEK